MGKVKKLVLNKETFAVLTNAEQTSLKGGGTEISAQPFACVFTNDQECGTAGHPTLQCPISNTGAGGSGDGNCDDNLYRCGGTNTCYECYPDDNY